jgi:hypothetical protein
VATKRTFKVTKKLSGGKSEYRKWSEWAEGDVVIGKLVSTGIDTFKKPNYKLEIEDAQLADKALSKSLTGKMLTLNSSGMLDKAMTDVSEGQMLQITYGGTAEIEEGPYKGKESHIIQVDLVELEEAEDDL